MPNEPEIIQLLYERSDYLTTDDIRARMHGFYKASQIRPLLRDLLIKGILEKKVIDKPTHKRGDPTVVWALSYNCRKRINEEIAESHYKYKSVYDLPFSKRIFEWRIAHTGHCEVCGLRHPFPHRLYERRAERRKINKL